MQRLLYIFSVIIFVIIFFGIGYFAMRTIDRKYISGKVLSETTENNREVITPTPTSIPSPIPTITPSPVPKPTKIPVPTSVPQPKVTQQEIHTFMERFSGQYGVDVNVLRHLAVCESGFNPLAVNGPYAGLFQFNKTTWVNNRRSMGEDANPDLRFNAEESIQTTAYLVSLGKRYLWPNCYP